MNILDELLLYYEMFPAVVLLRALEVGQFAMVGHLCKSPILDLGCGDGLIAKLAFGNSVDVGLDINEDTLKTAA